MAEGRMLKKQISRSRRLAELKTDSARMLYTWMIAHLDIKGRLEANPEIVKGEVVPRLTTFTPKKIQAYLEDMSRVGLIILFRHDGDQYLEFRKFEDHQNLRPDKESASRIPNPPDFGTIPGGLPEEDRSSPDEVKLREEKLREEKKNIVPSPETDQFAISLFQFWNDQQIIVHKDFEKFKRPIVKALEVFSLEEIQEAITNYRIVLEGGEYFWTYRWSLKEFLTRGIEKFLTRNNPFENFRTVKNGKANGGQKTDGNEYPISDC